MTRVPNAKLVERLQGRVSSGFFVDTAVHITYSNDSFDEYGQHVQSSIETEIDCSFTDKPKMESWQNYADIEEIVAEIRYTGAQPTKGDRFRLVNRFDRNNYAEDEFTPQEFEVVGIRDRDAFGYVVALREVQL